MSYATYGILEKSTNLTLEQNYIYHQDQPMVFLLIQARLARESELPSYAIKLSNDPIVTRVSDIHIHPSTEG
jgi:hypothetical protein